MKKLNEKQRYLFTVWGIAISILIAFIVLLIATGYNFKAY